MIKKQRSLPLGHGGRQGVYITVFCHIDVMSKAHVEQKIPYKRWNVRTQHHIFDSKLQTKPSFDFSASVPIFEHLYFPFKLQLIYFLYRNFTDFLLNRLYCFDIICNCVGGTRTYRFSAADQFTRDTWIDYLHRVSTSFSK